MKAVTRIRVLASDRMAELALGLHERTEIEVALFKESKYDEFVDGRAERIAAFHVDRDVFIDEAQRLLGIREALEARLRLRRK